MDGNGANRYDESMAPAKARRPRRRSSLTGVRRRRADTACRGRKTRGGDLRRAHGGGVPFVARSGRRTLPLHT
uniref:Uncharacterized protein n=1 Tax=Arundo donax TaxID=35708 RepID=A0A0A9CAC3_ARUDO